MALYKCTGCGLYGSEGRYGAISGVTYVTTQFFDSYEGYPQGDEEEARCEDCGTDIEEFEQIEQRHIDRLQRKLNMPLDELAAYLNQQNPN
jgi:hypothetical protein